MRIPRVTCEIRHFEGGTSVVLAAPEGSERFRAAKLQVWSKHRVLENPDAIANAFERQKRLAGATYSSLVETKGQVDHLMRDVARIERERAEVVQQAGALSESMNAYAHRIGQLEGSLAALNDIVIEYTQQTIAVERLERELDAQRIANETARGESAQREAEIRRLYVEIERLNGLLDMIYRSRTWKIHNLMEKVRGRG